MTKAGERLIRGAQEALAYAKSDDTVAVLRLPVECGSCGWKGVRATGNVVWCPKCNKPAAFQWPGKGEGG